MKDNSILVSGKSLESALQEAAQKFGVDEAQLDFEIRSSSKKSIFQLFRPKKVEVSVWKKGSKAESHSASLSAEEVQKICKDIVTFCEDMCEKIVGQPVQVDWELRDGKLVLNSTNAELLNLMNKNAKFADSIEHLLRKKPRYVKQELPFRIFFDVKGTRSSRENELVQMAKDLSEKVHENKRPIVLNSKSSYDRRIIHMTLDKDDRVYTKSIGSGPGRKLMILPAKPQHRRGKKADSSAEYDSEN